MSSKNRGMLAVIILVTVNMVILLIAAEKRADESRVTNLSTASPSASVSPTVSPSQTENDATLSVLKDAGVDTTKIENKAATAGGGTILGGALPAVAYKTLSEAESAFGYYLGLHNKMGSLTGYNLVGMYIIDGKVMQGIYESSDATKTITVKTSKIEASTELVSVYSKYSLDETIEINGVSVKLLGSTKESFNLAYFSVPNGKGYSIHTDSGLSETDMNKLLTELINNLQSMDDWVS